MIRDVRASVVTPSAPLPVRPSGGDRLFLRLLYGTGMRLMEGLRLRLGHASVDPSPRLLRAKCVWSAPWENLRYNR